MANTKILDKETTFLKQPLVRDLESITGKVAYMGIGVNSSYPLDSLESGVRYGPDAVRKVSLRYSNVDNQCQPLKVFNVERGYLLDGVTVEDLGNLDLKQRLEEDDRTITAGIGRILVAKSLPLIIGGDHHITLPILKAYDSDLTVVQFDAHGDYMNEKDCPHGSVMRYVSNLPNVKRVIHCGLRGNLNAGAGLVESVHSGNKIITSKMLKEQGIECLLREISDSESLYCTFDTDFLDPSIAPGTGCMEPGGINYDLAKALLTETAKKGKIMGMDITEYNPVLDYNLITGVHLTNLIFETLSSIFNVNNTYHKQLAI